ncbi:MAG: YebC/PmpR family DNA-binding transcriptional regulator [Candidatus Gastranaerophilales bacterium]|nr:YebC/PmpR family DNA-binding transcriptional regulator [Candidatus Gastranaerophilales bacterium]
MSGHSKWATIKRKKASIDAARGVEFAKFSREIMVATKLGGPDLNGNFRLRTAVDKAKAAGLPKDNIKRAIEKASGAANGENFEEITYEGYGPSGVAIIVEALTDNRNRTAGDIRSYFSKNNGNLGESGCVGFMFKKEGIITINKDGINQDELFEKALDAGAADFVEEDEEYKITTEPNDLQAVSEALQSAGYELASYEVTMTPQNSIEITDLQDAKYLLRLMDSLESHDDVQNVYSNFDMDSDLYEKASEWIS